MEHLKLSDGEWKLMKTLWAQQGQTLAELVAALDADTGWSRATIFMMLKRLIQPQKERYQPCITPKNR